MSQRIFHPIGSHAWALCFLLPLTLLCLPELGALEDPKRVPWNDSRFEGTPDPPLPLVLERAYAKQEFKGPVAVVPLPGTDRLVVVELTGKIFSFSTSKPDEPADLMVDLRKTPPPNLKNPAKPNSAVDLYSITFHPDFVRNRLAYICYIATPTNPRDPFGTHIASFRITEEAFPKIDIASEKTILTCGGGGHNGCTLLFGPDGYLYISIGDLEDPSPPDRLNTGQDITDLFASILRIDVDRPEGERPYSIPKDNPFLHITNAKPEVYAFGFRNPWRMSFDVKTGDLWVGDVGWEMYEMVYRVRSGGNYGWSIKEGPGDVKPQGKLGPTPILPADVALSHADAASVTGGFVYRGSKLPEIQGKYIFGDWITRRFWSVSFDEKKVHAPVEIASTAVKPICFALDHDGELLVLDYSNNDQMGGLYRFQPNPAVKKAKSEPNRPFPVKLSDSGLYSDLASRTPAKGVTPYDLNAPMFADGADAEYLLAIPGEGQAVFHQEGQATFDWFKTKVHFPTGTVLAKTYTLLQKKSDPKSRFPVETQVAHYAGVADWRFYTYRWNEAGTEATLVGAEGEQRTLPTDSEQVDAPESKRTWSFASRAQCRTCHTSWAGESLGMIEPQLRRPRESTDSWERLLELGFARLGPGKKPAPKDRFTAMAGPNDHATPIGVRARTYLHVNCSHCHMFGAVGSSTLDFPFDKLLAETKSVDQPPMKGTFGFPDAKLIAPGSPGQSLVLYRLAKAGTGRMPHIGAESVDLAGVQLLHDWILQLPKEETQREALDRLTAPMGRVSEQERMEACEKLFATSMGGLRVSHAIRSGWVPEDLRERIVQRALESDDVLRDAFEPLAKPSQRTARLGSPIKPQLVLDTVGDLEAGKRLFQRGIGQCNQCHRVDGESKATGPDLSKIGAKYTREKLLEQILNPSAVVDPAYQAVIVLTSDGVTSTGRVLARNDKELQLQPAAGDPKTILIEDIELEKKSDLSLMPSDLFSTFTKQQAADLLAYLQSLK